ncbi:MAG: hypothetical protein HRT90_07425 [Candidatus Margulisbacteria bacterium]|nr:hypothetical protein [Candidatus Margulisiibacteriota bacterium]
MKTLLLVCCWVLICYLPVFAVETSILKAQVIQGRGKVKSIGVQPIQSLPSLNVTLEKITINKPTRGFFNPNQVKDIYIEPKTYQNQGFSDEIVAHYTRNFFIYALVAGSYWLFATSK